VSIKKMLKLKVLYRMPR